MDSRARMLKALSFEEPDRIPIEMIVNPKCLEMKLPGAARLFAFQKDEADNFRGVPGFDWGFHGLDTVYREEVVEDVPGQFRRMRKIHTTPAGEFTALTKHTYDDLFGEGDPNDYHWEKRFFETIDDLRRMTEAVRDRRRFELVKYNQGCVDIGNRGLPCISLFHPLGTLVRHSNLQEVYAWLVTEQKTIFEYLEKCTEQICDSVQAIAGENLDMPPIFRTHALEMLISPWLSKPHFNQLVFPYDLRVNQVIHAVGGRHFAHSHGCTAEYLELFADMGIDGLEPLEPPPYGDNDLAAAKRLVGNRIFLAGNIPSPSFALEAFPVESIREMVKQAIQAGGPGGGFLLRTTGSAQVGSGKTREQRIKSIACGQAMIEAWREFSG